MRLPALAGCLMVMAALLAACGDTGQEEPPGQPGPSAQEPPPAAPEPQRPLGDKWYVDENDNVIPDFVEVAIGRDPSSDSCAPTRCELPDDASLRELTDGQNTLILLDSSGSMAGPAGGGETKMQAARQAIGEYVANTPRGLDRIGLAVYGHKGNNQESSKRESCRSAEVLEPPGELDADNVADVLGRFRPTGWTPIGRALRTAEQAFQGTEGEINQVILVSDGIETCDGDPVAAARALDEAGVSVTTDVVGFDVPRQADKELLRRIAQAGGGEYADAQTGADLRDFFAQLVEQRQQLTGVYGCLNQEFTSVYICQNKLYTSAYIEMNGLEYETFRDGDEAGAEEITRLKEAVLEEGERRKETTLEQQEQALEEIQAQIDEIGQRLEDQEGG